MELIPQEMQQTGEKFLQIASTLKVTDATTNEEATNLLETINGFIQDIDNAYRPHIQNAHRAHKALTTELAEKIAPFKARDTYLRAELKIYKQKKDEEAAAVARAEKARLEAIEKAKIEDERKIEQEKAAALAKELAEKRAAEAAEKRKISEAEVVKRKEELDRMEKQMAEAAAKAQELARQKDAVNIEVATQEIETPKSQGWRDNWKFKVVDIKLIPRAFMIPNEELLNKIAKDGKGETVISGIEFWNDKTPIIYKK